MCAELQVSPTAKGLMHAFFSERSILKVGLRKQLTCTWKAVKDLSKLLLKQTCICTKEVI